MKSLSSRALEKILEIVGAKKIYEHENFLMKNKKNNQKLVKPPVSQKYFWNKNDIEKFYYYSSKIDSDRVIVYFHGGAFVSQPNIFHWIYLRKLKRKTKSKIYFPIYPKSPEFNYKIAYDFLFDFYKTCLNENPDKEIIFIGDSAGGNIALSFAEQLKIKKLKTPNKIILFSPCLDLTLSNSEIDNIEKQNLDLMLSKKGLKLMYEAWANKTNLKNPILSPMFGDYLDIGEISIFVGTNEILYPEAKGFYAQAKQKNVSINYFEKQQQNHAYVLHPISEAKEAFKIICEIIKK